MVHMKPEKFEALAKASWGLKGLKQDNRGRSQNGMEPGNRWLTATGEEGNPTSDRGHVETTG